MENIYIIVILFLVVLLGIAIFALHKHRQPKANTKNSNCKKFEVAQVVDPDNKEVSLHFENGTDDLEAKGNLNEFIITVNNRYLFKCKDGVIIASQDKQKSSLFKEYKELSNI